MTLDFLARGAFETRRIASIDAAAIAREGITPDQARARRLRSIPADRLGDAAEFGAACAIPCSARAGYITGQSLLIDGRAFQGVL